MSLIDNLIRNCDNTDCKNKNINAKTYLVQLIKDFSYDICSWCAECIVRDKDMVYITEREYKDDFT